MDLSLFIFNRKNPHQIAILKDMHSFETWAYTREYFDQYEFMLFDDVCSNHILADTESRESVIRDVQKFWKNVREFEDAARNKRQLMLVSNNDI